MRYKASPRLTAAASLRPRPLSFEVEVLRPKPIREWVFWALFLVYAAVCVVVYFQYVEPWINGDITTRIGADSDRLWNFVKEAGSSSSQPLLSVTGNLIGPVAVGLFFKNGFGVMCFNFFLFILSLAVAGTIPNVNKAVFGFLMLANAELLPSLTTLNKEILAVFASVLAAKYLYSPKRSKLLLALVLLLSIFTRWEQAAMLILYICLDRILFPKKPLFSILFLIAAITVAYPFAFKVLGVDPNSFDWVLEGANTILTLDHIQNAFGYPLVVLPKVLMLMGGSLISPRFYTDNVGLTSGFGDVQQTVFQPLGCAAFLVLFGYCVATGRMRLNRPIPLLCAITLVVTAASPFIQPRYAYGVYVLLCIEASRRIRSSDNRRLQLTHGAHWDDTATSTATGRSWIK